ncbi:MAG: sensor domain-containing diguanylate cyclase [Lachnospira sp.]|nr:sensor domain-containing diguanylate cyclase [Lachnospira sp.]
MEKELELCSGDNGESVRFLDRRMAALDKNHIAFVTNKAFTDYFGTSRCDHITGYVHPDEREQLEQLLDSYHGEKESGIFRFMNASGQYRYNLIVLQKESRNCQPDTVNIVMVDIEEAYRVNDQLGRNVMRMRALLGIAEEYAFVYDRDTNVICIYRYEIHSREIMFRMDIEQWKKEMLENEYIAEKDIPKFISLIGEIKAYSESFSAKLTTGIRTRNQLKETLRFNGILYHGENDEKMVIGRISEESGKGQKRTVEMIEGLTFDSLTHVYNKKTITEYAKKLISEEQNNKVTLVILDVDHFKPVNDTYGHLYGDKVLERFGEKLKEIVGEDGTVGRIGGDEFMIVLNGINDDQLLRGMLRAIRTQIKWEFIGDFDDLMITCSIGAAISPDNGTDYEELFKKADYCLYIAKEKGRDRYVFFRDEMHQKAYEESVSKDKSTAGTGREMRELRVMSQTMYRFNTDPRGAVKALMEHMVAAYRLDSLNLFLGEELRRVQTIGEILQYCDDAGYVFTDEFMNLLGEKDYVEIGFVGNHNNDAPEFCSVMRQRRVFSTIQCMIGDRNHVKGLLTLDRCKESSQWAEYEVECAVMLASLITILVKEQTIE